MDCTSMSFPSPPSLVRSLSNDPMMMDTSPDYSSPMRSVQQYAPHAPPPTGLGISHCDMGPCVEQSRVYTCEPYPSPTTDWSDQIMPPESILDAALDGGPFSPATQYEYDHFGGYPDVSASPLSYYGSQTLSASPEYGVPMDLAGPRDMMHSQSSGMWPDTNCCHSMEHSDSACKIKEESEPSECWDQSLVPVVANASTTSSSAVAPPPMAQHLMTPTTTNNNNSNNQFAHPQQAGSSSTNGRLVEVHPGFDRLSSRDQRSVGQNHPYEVILKWSKDNGELSNDLSKIPSASGLECTTCGARFTRRSNCREHMKKHDPSRRKLHPCETCERRFGRRTDLRRHVDSIHRGIRKFACDLCDQKFSRQDTLTRHRPDCEKRKRRVAKAAKREDPDTAGAAHSSTTADIHEIKTEPLSPM